ncbi:MAG: acyl carrier protein [Paracoccaceae bacterium]
MTADRSDVRGKVIAIIARQALVDVSLVRPAMSLQELGLDSLGLVEVIFAIEETFDIAVPFNANEPDGSPFDTSSVTAVIGAVEALLADQPA